MSTIYKGARPTTYEQYQRTRYRGVHDAVTAMTTMSEPLHRRGGGGDGVAGAMSFAELLDLYKQFESYWTPVHAEQEIDRRIFNLAQQVNVPDGYNVVRPSTGNSVILTLADHVAGDRPMFKVPEQNLSLKAARNSEHIEKGLQAAIDKFTGNLPNNPVRTMVVNFGWAGMAVSQGPIFLPELWGYEPERKFFKSEEEYEEALGDYQANKRLQWPFWWRMVDPRYSFPDPGTTGKQMVMVSYDRTVASIKAQFPEWSGRKTNSYEEWPIQQRLRWLEAWDCTHRYYTVGYQTDGEIIDVARHRYVKPPFQIRAAGFGDETGETFEQFRSLIFPARSLINQEIRVLTQLDAVMRNAAWTQMLTPEGSNFTQLMPGTVTPMKREDIDLTRPVTELRGEVVQALLQEHEIISNGIEEATYPSVVRGVRTKGVSSGYGQNSLAALGKIKFGSVAGQTASLLQEWGADFLRCVERVVEEPLPIWGPNAAKGFDDFALKPKDINGYYYCLVTLNPKLPIDRANEIQVGSVLYNNGEGVIDSDTYLSDFAGYEQPEEMRIRVMRDRIMRLPQVQQVMMLAALDETGMLDFLVEAARKIGMEPGQVLASLGLLQAPQQAPVGPGGGAPGGGGAASLSGARMNPGPSAQAEPMPGGINSVAQPMSQAEAAAGAGVPGPGGVSGGYT